MRVQRRETRTATSWSAGGATSDGPLPQDKVLAVIDWETGPEKQAEARAARRRNARRSNSRRHEGEWDSGARWGGESAEFQARQDGGTNDSVTE